MLGADVYGLSLSTLPGKSLFTEITKKKTLSKDFLLTSEILKNLRKVLMK